MLELSLVVSIIILAIYIRKKNLKPSKTYIGANSESSLIRRAKEVIYYNTLKNITTLIFPLIVAFTYFTEFMEAVEKLYNSSWLRFILFTVSIILVTIIISKTFTKIAVKRAKKKNNLKRYIGGMWIDTSL